MEAIENFCDKQTIRIIKNKKYIKIALIEKVLKIVTIKTIKTEKIIENKKK